MKKRYFILALAVCLLAGCAQSGENSPSVAEENGMRTAVELAADLPTTQSFSDDAVSQADLEIILLSGVNAPSAMNAQPWHFTAVTDKTILERVADDMSGRMRSPAQRNGPDDSETPGSVSEDAAAPIPMSPGNDGVVATRAGIANAPLAVIVSCVEGSEFDAGLACQAMSMTAQLLGYGTKIISSPTIALNSTNQDAYRQLLDIPENESAVAVLLIGYADNSADVATGATVRNPVDEMVSYVTPQTS